MKSIYVLQLLSTKKVHSFRSVREEETEILMKKIEEKGSSAFNLSDMILSDTIHVISRVAFGRKFDEGGKFKKLFDEFMYCLGLFNLGDYIPWLKVKRVVQEFDQFLEESMKNATTILDSLSIERVAIKALILDAFSAGSHTSSTVLEWTMTELLRHPNKMPYSKAVLKETLRLYPLIPLLVAREATNDVKICGYDVRAGTMAITNAWAIGRDPSIWDNPNEFKPERFLGNNSLD
ncbi:hypothetical protein ACFE04_000832 [Oxalis oulophora]